MFLLHVHTFNEHKEFMRKYAKDFPFGSLVLSCNYYDRIIFFYLHVFMYWVLLRIKPSAYTTSGASDTIFWYPRSASSRGIGPKIRPAFGSNLAFSIITPAFSSK